MSAAAFQAVDHGNGGNGAITGFQGRQNIVDHRARDEGPGAVVNQYLIRAQFSQSPQAVQDRLLPVIAARYGGQHVQALCGRLVQLQIFVTNDGGHRLDGRMMAERKQRVAQHGNAGQALILLGYRAAEPFATAARNHQCHGDFLLLLFHGVNLACLHCRCRANEGLVAYPPVILTRRRISMGLVDDECGCKD